MYFTYVLFSPSLDKYYIGHCKAPLAERLRKHNTNHKGFTGKASDWVVVHHQIFPSKTEAYAIERKIKRAKSRKLLEALANN